MMMNQGPPQQQPMQPQQQQQQQGQNRFYVGGLDWNTGNDQLRAAFQIYGDLKDVHVMMADGRSKGYGFITFHDGVAAQEAGLLNGNISVDGREVTVSAAHPRGEARNAGGMGGGGFGAGGGGRGAGPAAWGAGRQGGGRGGGAGAEPNKIFVGGLSDEITEQDLTAYFNGFGTVSFVRVATDQETQRPRGFAFVCFEEAECAQRCVNSTVPHTINGCNLNVKMSKPKSQQGGFGGGGGGGGGGFGGHQGGNDGGFGFRGGFGTMSSGREERGFGGGGGGGNRFGNLGLGGSQPGGPPQQQQQQQQQPQQQPQQQGYPPRGAPSQNPGYGAHTGYSRPDAAPRGFNAPNPNANQAPVSISPASYGQNNYDAIASAFGIGGVGGGDYSNLGGFSNTQLPPQQQPPQGNGY